MSSSKSTVEFQILKAIDVSYEKQNFNLKETLNLEKLGITEHRFNLLLENLVNNDFLTGLNPSRTIDGSYTWSINSPRLTSTGLDYLENFKNSQK